MTKLTNDDMLQVDRVKVLVSKIMVLLVEENATPPEGMTAVSMALTSSAVMFGVDKATLLENVGDMYNEMSNSIFDKEAMQ